MRFFATRYAGIPLLAFFAGVAPLFAADSPAPPIESTPEGTALLHALEAANYQLTPAVKDDFLTFAKARALREIAAEGKTVPPDFLAWIDSDPIVRATVYGARENAADVLLMLRSLDLDLGSDVVRRHYTQLALAVAVVEAKQGATADVTPRAPMKLVIPGDPRRPVDTHAKDRPLDVNDYTINFLEDHPPIDGEVFGRYEQPPVLKYDAKGAALMVGTRTPKTPAPELKYDGNGVAAIAAPGVATIKRPMLAADVIESKQLQDEFNAYMAAHGQSVRIHCGDHQISPNWHDGIHGPYAQGILDAFKLFRTAYEAKGRLPAQRDPMANPAERCAFIIRNDEFRFPADQAATRKWPRYPLTAPWPTLTLLAAADEPLRERDEIWTRFADTGETINYGEYIGGIAQQYDFQSARRLSPYPFTYKSFQMMMKDGGVCGTMATMGVRTDTALGIPACTAGQPGHCALICFEYDAKNNAYICHGGQYATGGDDDTHPHGNWVFGDTDQRRDMVWYQTVAWGVNAGFQSYLDSMLALDIYRDLPAANRKARGLALLAGGLSVNPYNFALVEAALGDAGTEALQVAFNSYFTNLFAKRAPLPDCPVAGLYNVTVEKLAEHRLDTMKPVSRDEALETLAYLTGQGLAKGGAATVQSIKIEGAPAVMDSTRQSFAAYLASDRTDADCDEMAGAINAVAASLPGRGQRAAWASSLGAMVSGREYRFDAKNHLIYDQSIKELVKLAGYRKEPEQDCYRALQQQVEAALKASVSGQRTVQSCRVIAARIVALGKAMKDASADAAWQNELRQILAGKEMFLPPNRPNGKPVTDPCVAAIAKLGQLAG